MNRREIKDAIGELYGSLYWFRRNPNWWHDKGENFNVELAQIKLSQLQWDFDQGNFEEETNERGNIIRRGFINNGNRYSFEFDTCSRDKGWKQYDTNQDAWYFGVWVHFTQRKILTYAEGDVTLVECPTQEQFVAEIRSMNEFYGDPPPAFKCISMDGKVTHIYDHNRMQGGAFDV